MNKINTYGYAVFGNHGQPFHTVEIKSEFLSAFCVFNCAKDAKDYILREKERLSAYGISLEYDSDFRFSDGLLKTYISEKYGLFSKIENRQVYVIPVEAQ